jgi:hypothetical protein
MNQLFPILSYLFLIIPTLVFIIKLLLIDKFLSWLPLPEPITFIVLLFSSLLAILSYFNNYASQKQCGKSNHKNSLKYSSVISSIASLVYLLVYFIQPLRTPFRNLLNPDKVKIGDTIAYAYWILVIVLMGFSVSYFYSLENNCKMSIEEKIERTKELQKFLNTPLPEENIPQVQVKH